MARGSYSSERKVCSQATVQPMSSSASRKKVRQKRLKPELQARAAVTLRARFERARHRDLRAVLLSGAWSGGWADGHLSTGRQAVPSGTNT
jgi:hypothetical protein